MGMKPRTQNYKQNEDSPQPLMVSKQSWNNSPRHWQIVSGSNHGKEEKDKSFTHLFDTKQKMVQHMKPLRDGDATTTFSYGLVLSAYMQVLVKGLKTPEWTKENELMIQTEDKGKYDPGYKTVENTKTPATKIDGSFHQHYASGCQDLRNEVKSKSLRGRRDEEGFILAAPKHEIKGNKDDDTITHGGRGKNDVAKHKTDADNDCLDTWGVLDSRFLRIRPQVLYVMNVPTAPLTRVWGVPWVHLNVEARRLQTFCNYPVGAAKSAILLAADGFAYIGTGAPNDDEVICYFCINTYKGWLVAEVIRDIHTRMSANCPMVTGAECDNVPMPMLHNGDALFARLDKDDVRASSTLSRTTTGTSTDADIEADSAAAISEVRGDTRGLDQGLDQAQIQNPIQTSNTTTTASLPKPTQMATRSPTTNNISTARTAPNAAGSREERAYTVTAHQVTDVSASSAVIASSSLATSSSMFNPSSEASSMSRSSSDDTGNRTSAGNNTGDTREPNAAATSTDQPAPRPLQTASVTSGTPSATVGQPEPAQNQATVPAAQGAGQEGQQGSQDRPAEGNQQHQNNPPARRQDPSYAELGIITEKPKRLEYAVKASRLRSFEGWPRNHHLTKEDLADAGFYYAGYGDCARCFFCGGGLRNWDPTDNVWVEHARWFSKCSYMRQTKGQPFIDAVKTLSEVQEVISYDDVMTSLGAAAEEDRPTLRPNPLEKDAAIRAVVEIGFDKKDVIGVAQILKNEDSSVSADKLFERLIEMEMPWKPTQDGSFQNLSINIVRDKETVSELREKNSQLRAQTVCKVCLDAEVQIVFLPCGHLVSCLECAAALMNCPLCRQGVRGMVRVYVHGGVRSGGDSDRLGY